MSNLLTQEYTGVDHIDGPLLIIQGASNVGYNELAEITTATGEVVLGQVLAVSQDQAIVEIFGDSSGLHPPNLQVRFRGKPFRVSVAREMLGRVFDGLGRPRDELPPPIPEKRVDVYGAALNPVARVYPRDYVETGISAIDGMNTLVRGQKLPIFSGNGLPHNALAAQIAGQARISEDDADFAIVFAALGVSHDTATYFQRRIAETGALDRTALFLNLADEPAVERIITPHVALSLAEFLAFEQDTHVLVILTDMTNYGEALRELSSRREEVPTRKGYPGYLYSELARIYERCGRTTESDGSITLLPMLTMPNDDITHPIPDLTGYITEGQIVLSRDLDRQGIYPPIDVLSSLSRLMKDGIGAEETREDHADVSDQLYAAYSEVKEARNLADIIGEDDLPQQQKDYLSFGEAFEQEFLKQGRDEARSIEETLDIGWRIFDHLPRDLLTRLSEEQIEAHNSRDQNKNQKDQK